MYIKIEKNIYTAYVSKHNSNCEKQAIILIISNREGRWYYLSVKELSTLLWGISSKVMGIFVIWFAVIFLKQKTNLSFTKEHAKIKIFEGL